MTQRLSESGENDAFSEFRAAGWEVHGPEGSSVCEVEVALSGEAKDTVERLEVEMRRLQTLEQLIDDTIRECKVKKACK